MNYSKQTTTKNPIKVSSRPQSWLQRTPAASAVMTKLIPDTVTGYTKPGNGVDVKDVTIFDSLVARRAQKNLDAETLIGLAPDLKLIKQMLVSTTLSPVDMTSGNLEFKNKKSDIPPSVLNPITEVIREHFETYYPLREKLPEIIGEALFDAGAWVGVIIPEAVIDDIINVRDTGPFVSNEAYDVSYRSNFVDGTLKSVGILGEPGETDLEVRNATAGKGRRNVNAPSLENMLTFTMGDSASQAVNDAVSITDNIAIMGMGTLRDRLNSRRIESIYRGRQSHAAMESHQSSKSIHNKVSTVTSSLYKNRPGAGGIQRVATIGNGSDASRSSIGHPLVIKCPSESVIPCFPRGEERNHIGYVIILDELGNPLNLTDEMDRAVGSGSVGLGGTQQMNMTSTLIQQTRVAMNGMCMDTDKLSTDERVRVFNQVLEENILNRIKNGLVGRNVKMAWNEDIMRVMLFRHFANQRTNIVFVGAEQVVYFAYDYDANGMGKSLLDDVKQVSALRAMTTFANFMAGVKNAVGRTKVTMNIDPRNPDPEKAYHILMDEYQRMQSTITPTDISSSAEMFRSLRMMGTTIEVQGNPRMPNTTVEISEHQSQKQQIDEAFTEDLRRQQYMGLFVTPGMVDMTDDADFAITRWTSNQLYAKRIMMIQDDTCKHGRKFVKVYTNSDGTLVGKIQAIFKEHNDKLPEELRVNQEDDIPQDLLYRDAIEAYWDSFYLELPRPENNRVEKQKEEFDKVKDLVDDILEAHLNDEMFGAFLPEDQENIGLLRAHLKSYMLRQYMSANGIDFGISRIMNKVTEEDPALDLMKEFGVNVGNAIQNFGDFSKGFAAIREELLKKLEVTNPVQAEVLKKDDGFSSDSGGGGFDDNSGGGDDFGGGGDGFDNPPDFDDAGGDLGGGEGGGGEGGEEPPIDDSDPFANAPDF